MLTGRDGVENCRPENPDTGRVTGGRGTTEDGMEDERSESPSPANPDRLRKSFLASVLCRSRFEMSGPKLLFQLDFTAAAGHGKMPSAYQPRAV
jgi:hypothetical protein